METEYHPWFDPDVLVGAKLHGYPLEMLLGLGGFGAVYRTRSPEGTPRAIKVLYPLRSSTQEDTRVWDSRATHFLREAQTATRFSHPNIIRVYDTGQVHWRFPGRGLNPLVFYVADFLPDGVDRRLRDGRLFTSEDAIDVVTQVCDALEALHHATPQILHRDLNPGNIRLAEGGRVVLSDFGVARIEGVTGAYVTTEGPVLHKGISAPEQFLGEEPDVRTDVYQCGALLFVMLTGVYPRQADPDARTQLERKRVPVRLAQALLQCLETDRTKRFQDATALKTALLLSPPAPGPPQLSGPRAPRLTERWQLRFESPGWRISATPIAEDEGGCYFWDNQTVYCLSADTGMTKWTWRAASQIRDSFQSPAVQAGGQRLYVRHGDLLSCLDAHGVEQWQHKHWSDNTGAFLAVRDLVIVDSYRDGTGELHGPAALDARTGKGIWALQESVYHVDHLVASDEVLALIESVGVSGSGGVRVRAVDLSDGTVTGDYDLLTHQGEITPTPGAKAVILPQAPMMAPDGSIVVWTQDLARSQSYVWCSDRWLSPRWAKALDFGAGLREGQPSLVISGDHLLAFLATHDGAGNPDEGWFSGIDLQSGESLWHRKCPDGGCFTNPVADPSAPVVFAFVHYRARSRKGKRRWRLTAIDPRSGVELWRGPERGSPSSSPYLTPVVTPTHVYLQVAAAPLKDLGGLAGGVGRGSIEAFQRW